MPRWSAENLSSHVFSYLKNVLRVIASARTKNEEGIGLRIEFSDFCVAALIQSGSFCLIVPLGPHHMHFSYVIDRNHLISAYDVLSLSIGPKELLSQPVFGEISQDGSEFCWLRS